LFGRSRAPNIGNARTVTDAERLEDIRQKLCCWRYLSHFPDAERDMAWLLELLAERDGRITELETRLTVSEWTVHLP
jgi:hypothetical protein